MNSGPNGSAVPRPQPETATYKERQSLASHPETESLPSPSEEESPPPSNLNGAASPHQAAPMQAPVSEAPTPQMPESEATLPKEHIAWSQERQMRQLIEMNPEQLAKFRSDYRDWIGGELARGAKIDLTSYEIQQLSYLFMDSTMDFCMQWHPILKDGLAQPGEARDRLELLNAVDPDMMLMLYAIPARRKEITDLVGAERYEKMKGTVDGAFQEWYQELTNGIEYSKWIDSLDNQARQKVEDAHQTWGGSLEERPTVVKWIESEDFRNLKREMEK